MITNNVNTDLQILEDLVDIIANDIPLETRLFILEECRKKVAARKAEQRGE
jgi:hypothetical protein